MQLNVKGLSPCHARLRVEQDFVSRERIWSRFHDQNYIKLDPEAKAVHDRCIALRGALPIDAPSGPEPGFTITIEVPVTGPDSLDLQREADGTAYITLGRIVPVMKSRPLINKTPYPSYSGQAFGSDSASTRFSRWRNWLEKCCYSSGSADHSEQRLSNLAGFSLVDVTIDEVVPATPGMKYAALSYVWGQEITRTSKSHAQESRYPRTIRDALTFTATVGLRYLWVDAVCIPSEPSERAEQIQNMDAIYKGAAVVIIAASSEHSEFGLHGISLETKPQIRTHFGHLELVFRAYDYADYLAMSKWSTRGWCLQEGLLAQRRFIITDQEIFLECCRGLHHESKSDSKIFWGWQGSGILDVIENFWREICSGEVGKYADVVTSYLRKDLTRESDIADAFTGLANSLNVGIFGRMPSRSTPTQSCWGFPCRYFGAALTWYPILTTEHPPRRRTLSLQDCVLPSWSWMAWRIKGIDYTRWMRMDGSRVFPKFNWSDEVWSAAVKTGLIEFEAEVVSFEDGIPEARDKDDLEYDLNPAWTSGEGSFLSIKGWKVDLDLETVGRYPGLTYGRFALRIKKMGGIIYRVGHEINIPDDEWEKGRPVQMHVKLG